MMRRFLFTLLLATAGSAFALPPDYAPKGWEQVKSYDSADTRTVIKEAELEIKSAPSAILVVAPHPVQIKVFTILGRIVSDTSLPAGTSRLTLPAHGVYIIKAGTLTCKIAV